MNFLPGDVVSSLIQHERLNDMASELRPLLSPSGLRAEVAHGPQSGVSYVSLPLPTGGQVIMYVDPRRGAWMVVRPIGHGEPTEVTAWPLDTPRTSLVEIAAEAARASYEGRFMRSPYCWGRAEPSVITELAEALVTRGLPAGDIQVSRALTVDGEKLVRHRGHLEQLVMQEEMDAAQVEVALRPGLGWTADLEVHGDPGSRGRMDLRFAAHDVREPRPDMPLSELSVDDLAWLLSEWWPADPEDPPRWGRLWRYAPTPRLSGWDDEDLAAWFRWCGFTDVRPQGTGRRVQLTGKHLLVHVHAASSIAGLPLVQRVQGQASLTASRAAVVASAGFSRPARRWADEAGVALFWLEYDSVPRPANEVAEHLMPKPGETLLSECDDSACRQIGCVLEDEYCPSALGREWSDSSSYLWRQGRPGN